MLGTLVTDVELEPTPPLDLDCGECRLCIDACPTGALDEPGTLDSTRCLSYWTQAPAPPPAEYRAAPRRRRSTVATSARTSARGTAASRSGAPVSRCRQTRRRTSRSPTGCAATRTSCGAASTRLYVPRNDGRRLRLNALVAAGNVGGDGERDAVSAYLDDPDETMRELAAWALARMEERDA